MSDVLTNTGSPVRDVVVVGSGFAGLSAAYWLRKKGIRDVTILERSHSVGGTWRDNTFPGAACDVPSHLYSLSFAPNPQWSHSFSRQPEIQSYLVNVAERFDIVPLIRFNTELTDAFWDDEEMLWTLTALSTVDSEDPEAPQVETRYRCRYFISGAGALSDPEYPNLPGLEGFEGDMFHSARWRHDIDLRDRNVAVIGTGASAIQFVPEIQPLVRNLTLFQRTAPWVVPRRDREIRSVEKSLYAKAPWIQKTARSSIYLARDSSIATFLNPKFSKATQSLALLHLKRQVHDPTLRQWLTPNYTIGCKRILISNGYYPALSQDNVTVVPEAASLVTSNQIGSAGSDLRDADVIIFGTGFRVQNPPIAERIRGLGGDRLEEYAMAGGGALAGTMLHNFPNFFMVPGPNTGLGHTSQVVMIEAQTKHIAELLARTRRSGARSIRPRLGPQERWSDQIEQKMQSTVWTVGGCTSWYLDSKGRNSTLWPGSTIDFRRKLSTIDAREYEYQ